MDLEEKEQMAVFIANECGGIHFPYEAFYIHSILYSAGRCLESFDRFDHFKTQYVTPDYLVSIVQEAVGHAAALSRYFWPSPKGKKKEAQQNKLRINRGKKLRDAFGLNESSPLYNRDLRNAWEHFDERLDGYLLEHEAGMFFPSSIVDDHTLADDPIGHIFKLLDIDNNCLVLLGDKFFYEPIRNEVKMVFEKAMEFDQNGARFPICEADL